jgi:hypothetical protein
VCMALAGVSGATVDLANGGRSGASWVISGDVKNACYKEALNWQIVHAAMCRLARDKASYDAEEATWLV